MVARADLCRRAATGVADGLTRAIDYPLYVVTAGSDDEVSGCLAGFVTQCSINPSRFLICISKVNHTFGIAARVNGLALHLLGSGQAEMAALFGEESGDWAEKFDCVSWFRGGTGAPLLTECAAWVEGPILARLDAGDHEAFLITALAGGDGPYSGRLMLSEAGTLHPGHPVSSGTGTGE